MFGLVGVIGGVGVVWLIGVAEVGVGLAGAIGVETGLIVVAGARVGLVGAVGMACVFFCVVDIVGVF